MRSADEYAEMAERAIEAGARAAQRNDPHVAVWLAEMVTLSNLSIAAATIEAARLTIDAQASSLLSALEEPEPIPVVGELDYDPCLHAWYGCALGESPNHACQLVEGHMQARHVCVCGDVSR